MAYLNVRPQLLYMSVRCSFCSLHTTLNEDTYSLHIFYLILFSFSFVYFVYDFIINIYTVLVAKM